MGMNIGDGEYGYGVFRFPRPGRGSNPYPWIEAEPGDWFLVRADDEARARNSLRACAWQFHRSVDWRPVFEIKQQAAGLLLVQRVE
jgi:hypothetical protein